jgi:ribonuclease HI
MTHESEQPAIDSNTFTSVSTWQIHCDGTSLPNPGLIGFGAVIVSPDGSRHTFSESPGARGCNNEAEAMALIAALRHAQVLGARRLLIRCDSIVVVEQTTGRDRTKIERLARLFAEARALLASFEYVDFRWTPRAKNAEADALARAALGLTPKLGKPMNRRRRRR